MTESEQVAAIMAAINAALPPTVLAYEYGKVPGADGNAGTEPTKYVLVDLSRRLVDSYRGSGEASVKGGRVGTRYIAKSVNDGREMRRRVMTALEDKILTTAAGEVGPFRFETADPFQPDQGYQVATDTWTF